MTETARFIEDSNRSPAITRKPHARPVHKRSIQFLGTIPENSSGPANAATALPVRPAIKPSRLFLGETATIPRVFPMVIPISQARLSFAKTIRLYQIINLPPYSPIEGIAIKAVDIAPGYRDISALLVAVLEIGRAHV